MIDNALNYMLHLSHHIPKGDIPIATLALLIEMGFKTNIDGFGYLRHAILLKIEHPEMRAQELYSYVGKVHGAGASWKQVEHSLRRAIETAWERRDHKLWRYFFTEEELEKRPMDSLFISQMACMLELWCGCCKGVGCDE